MLFHISVYYGHKSINFSYLASERVRIHWGWILISRHCSELSYFGKNAFVDMQASNLFSKLSLSSKFFVACVTYACKYLQWLSVAVNKNKHNPPWEGRHNRIAHHFFITQKEPRPAAKVWCQQSCSMFLPPMLKAVFIVRGMMQCAWANSHLSFVMYRFVHVYYLILCVIV